MDGSTASTSHASDNHSEPKYSFGSTIFPSGKIEKLQCQKDKYSDILQTLLLPNLTVCKNGFVQAVMEAYNKHHNLIIRPDDVWGAILTQFSFYVNRAEEFRGKFVKYEETKKITICARGSMISGDFHYLVESISDKIDKHMVDPKLKQWILPNFSNPSSYSTGATQIALLSTVNNKCKYTFGLYSGIQSITVAGTVGDWKIILDKLEKLKEFKLKSWYHILQQILQKFVDAKIGKVDLNFWRKIVIYHGLLDTYSISGWIAAFCVVNNKGCWLQQLDAFSNYPKRHPPLYVAMHRLKIDIDKIPPGFVEVDVQICDSGTIYDTVMLAGHLATRRNGKEVITIQSIFGWVITLKSQTQET